MKYTPAEGGRLERWEVADGAGLLGIANEAGDITAFVRRPDGTHGHCYGGPVYDPPEFTNVCERPDPWLDGRWKCDHKTDMTPPERAVADVLARRVGWMDSMPSEGYAACDCPCHQVVQPGLVPCPQCEQESGES